MDLVNIHNYYKILKRNRFSSLSFPKTNLNIYGKKYYNFIASVLHKSGGFSASNSHSLVPFLFYGKKCTHRRSAHHPSSPLSPCSPSAFLSLPLLPPRSNPTDRRGFVSRMRARRSPGRRRPKCPCWRKRASSASSQGRKGEKVHFCGEKIPRTEEER